MSKSKKPSKVDQDRLHLLLENAWLNVAPEEYLSIKDHIFSVRDRDSDPVRDTLRIMRDPANFYLTCKVLLNVELLPFQVVILQQLWKYTFPILVGSRGLGKTFILAVYSLLRSLLYQGSKVVIVGSAFRQARFVFDYCQFIWQNSVVLRDIVDYRHDSSQGPKIHTDRCTLTLGTSKISALPIGDGSKIRGERATDILADEFGAQSREIFETVIAGFGVVSASPLQNVKQRAKIKKMEELGMPTKFIDEMTSKIRSNKIIISGTADYSWGHFCEYWKKWKTIIESKGDSKKLMEANIDPDIDWKDYSIIRIPVDLIPPGFMDEKQLARSKSTIHSGTYQSEFGSVFSSDSTGFFKRSMIEACVVKSSMNKSEFPRGADVFTAVLQGKPHKQYVFGIDPASERNNFSIIIQELYIDHTRVVYGWSTTRAIFREKLNKGITKESDFYKYAARKIRDLMRDFPCIRIAIDSQGGGYAVMEALNDPNNMEADEQPIWEIIDEDKPKETDDKFGLHIVKLVMFSSAEYTMNANHGLRKDMEDKVLLFPQFDHISIAQATETDLQTERIYDTLEDCVMEIEELKNELATIIHTQTGITGRDRWDTPETKLATGKKGKLNKDRYSALVMANAEARHLLRNPIVERPQVTGGFAHTRPKYERGGSLYSGPEWFVSNMNDSIGFCKK